MTTRPTAPASAPRWRFWSLLGPLISGGGVAILINEAMLQVLR